MRLSLLLSLQDDEREMAIVERYEHTHDILHWNEGYILDVSSERVRQSFNELNPQIRELYLLSIREDYLLSRMEFEQRFGDQGLELTQRGFYLWHAKHESFIPPDEFVNILAGGTLITTLIKCRKSELLKACKEKLSNVSRCILLREILHESYQRYAPNRLSSAEIDNVVQRLQPFQRILRDEENDDDEDPYIFEEDEDFDEDEDEDYALLEAYFDENEEEEWEELAKSLGIKVATHYRGGETTLNDYLTAFDHLLQPLYQDKLLFLVPNDWNFRLVTNPLVREAYTLRVVESNSKQFRQACKSLKPLAKATASLEHLESFHVSPEQLLRTTIILSAWIHSKRIGLTKDDTPKRVDLKRLAKILAPAKHEEPFYVQLLENSYYRCTSADAHQALGSTQQTNDIWQSIAMLEEKKLLALLVDRNRGSLLGTFLSLLDSLPTDEWSKMEEIRRLFDLYYCSKGGALGARRNFDYRLPTLLTLAQAFGRIDVLYPKKVKIDKGDLQEVTALRVVSASTERPSPDQKVELIIQGNLEIPIPADILLKKLFVAAQIFDLHDINTLKFSEAAVIKLADSGHSLSEARSAIEKCLANELPPAAKRILNRVFEERVRVFFDRSCIYLYDPSTLEQVKQLIPAERILEVIDDRLIVLKYQGERDAVVISRLKKNNVSIRRCL